MSRRKHRPPRCPQCWDMGAQAPVATHRVKAWTLGLIGPAFPYTVKLCGYHAHDALWWARRFGRDHRMRVYRFRSAR